MDLLKALLDAKDEEWKAEIALKEARQRRAEIEAKLRASMNNVHGASSSASATETDIPPALQEIVEVLERIGPSRVDEIAKQLNLPRPATNSRVMRAFQKGIIGRGNQRGIYASVRRAHQ